MDDGKICRLVSRIKRHTIVRKEGDSISQVFLGKIQSQDKKDVASVAVKILPIPQTEDPELEEDLDGFKYEARVYRHIIDNIVKKKQSPHFVTYAGFGKCHKDSHPDIQMLIRKLRGIRAKDRLPELGDEVFVLVTYNDPPAVTNFMELFPLLTITEQNQMLFQILYSIYVMQHYRLTHNDLHGHNILIARHNTPVTRFYTVPGPDGKSMTYKITSTFTPLIFDWDLAYSERLGPNEKLTYGYCDEYNVCNQFHPKFDMYTILCLANHLEPSNPVTDSYTDEVFYSKEKQRPIAISKELFMYMKQAGDFKRGKAGLQFRKYLATRIPASKFADLASKPDFIFEQNTDVWVELIEQLVPEKRYFMRVFEGMLCRPTVYSKDWPSAIEMLTGPLFADFLISETDVIDDEQLYQAPDIAQTGRRRVVPQGTVGLRRSKRQRRSQPQYTY